MIGIVKSALGFRQFLLRGLENVKGELNLVALAWNLKRMFNLSGASEPMLGRALCYVVHRRKHHTCGVLSLIVLPNSAILRFPSAVAFALTHCFYWRTHCWSPSAAHMAQLLRNPSVSVKKDPTKDSIPYFVCRAIRQHLLRDRIRFTGDRCACPPALCLSPVFYCFRGRGEGSGLLRTHTRIP